jgi:hypothetical protein
MGIIKRYERIENKTKQMASQLSEKRLGQAESMAGHIGKMAPVHGCMANTILALRANNVKSR